MIIGLKEGNCLNCSSDNGVCGESFAGSGTKTWSLFLVSQKRIVIVYT